MPRAIHLVTAIDDRYVIPLRVMIASLLERLDSAATPVLHVVQRALSAASREALSDLMDVRYVTPTQSEIELIPKHRTIAAEVGFPMLVPQLLPELERVLFLDADLLVLDDILPLWETPLGGKTLAAVPDPAIGLCSMRRGVVDWQTRGIPAEHPYFNGGVMLIDLDAWRTRAVTSRTLSYMQMHIETADFMHQGPLNATTWDDWLPLDRRWNLSGAFAGRRGDTSATNPGIVHFAGRMKPWLAPVGGPFEPAYAATMARLDLERPPSDLRRRALSFYDRNARDRLHPIERSAWRRGWV